MVNKNIKSWHRCLQTASGTQFSWTLVNTVELQAAKVSHENEQCPRA